MILVSALLCRLRRFVGKLRRRFCRTTVCEVGRGTEGSKHNRNGDDERNVAVSDTGCVGRFVGTMCEVKRVSCAQWRCYNDRSRRGNMPSLFFACASCLRAAFDDYRRLLGRERPKLNRHQLCNQRAVPCTVLKVAKQAGLPLITSSSAPPWSFIDHTSSTRSADYCFALTKLLSILNPPRYTRSTMLRPSQPCPNDLTRLGSSARKRRLSGADDLMLTRAPAQRQRFSLECYSRSSSASSLSNRYP